MPDREHPAEVQAVELGKTEYDRVEQGEIARLR